MQAAFTRSSPCLSANRQQDALLKRHQHVPGLVLWHQKQLLRTPPRVASGPVSLQHYTRHTPVVTYSTGGSTSHAVLDHPGQAQAVQPLYTGKKAVVVGAGPAGSTAAMFLARQGFTVEVFERRPEPSQDAVDTGRAYIIILIPRGQAALKELGVPLPTQQEYITKGTVRHNNKGQIGISREEGNVTFSRSSLAQYLIDQARQRYPDKISFHFNSSCQGVDIPKKQITFRVEDGSRGSSTVQQQYDLLVGADGVGSAVRAALQQHHPDMTVVIDDSGREYKVYGGVRGDIEPEEFKVNPGATLHLWTSDDPWTTCTAHSNPDGTYSGTLSLKTGGFKELHGPADYEALIRKKFVGLPDDWIPAIAQQAAGSTPSPAGKRIRCSRLDGPGVLLLGDAAHAVTPVFGQGANSALESCKVLGQVLKDAGGNLDEVPERFTVVRLDDMHALNELDRKAYSFFRRKGLFDPDFLQLLSHVALGTILSKLLPFLYGPKPALLQLGSSTPYSTITAAVKRDSLMAAVGFAALGLWVSFKVAAKLLAGA